MNNNTFSQCYISKPCFETIWYISSEIDINTYCYIWVYFMATNYSTSIANFFLNRSYATYLNAINF